MLILFIFVSVAVLHFVSAQHVSAVLQWQKRMSSRSPWSGVKDACELMCGLGPLEE